MKTILTSLLLLFFSIGSGQWTNNYSVNTLVSNSITNIQSTIGTKDGRTYIVYWDETAGANNYKLKLQLLDANGNKMFGDNGMILNNMASMSSFVLTDDLCVDADNNLYYVFTESGGNEGKAYLHKVSPQGSQLFGNNGVVISNGGYAPKIKLLNNNGFIISWTDRFMKYNSNGTKAWTNPVIIPTPTQGSDTINVGEISILHDNSFVIIFHVSSGGIDSNLWAQKYNIQTGASLWNAPIKLSNKVTHSNTRYSTAVDGSIVYIGYFTYDPILLRFDSFLQKINSNGSLPWGINGSDFATTNQFNEGPGSIIMDSSGFIWSSLTIANSDQKEFGLAVQKFNKETGARQLSDGSKIIFPVSLNSKVMNGKIQLLNEKPLLLFREAYDTGIDPVKYGLTYLDGNGMFIWPQQYQYIATSPTYKTSGSITEIVNSKCVITWTEDRGQGSRAFAQSFKIEGNLNTKDIVSRKFRIYPNPVKDFLNIMSDEDIKSVSLFDLSGKNIMKTVLSGNKKIDVSSLIPGGYLINIELKNGTVKTDKILKVK